MLWRKSPYKIAKIKIFIYAFNKAYQNTLGVILINIS